MNMGVSHHVLMVRGTTVHLLFCTSSARETFYKIEAKKLQQEVRAEAELMEKGESSYVPTLRIS
jgi:hypothetical protein